MAKTYSCLLVGVESLIVEIETVVGSGFSGLNILGLNSEVTRDMRERVRSALEAIHIPIPARRLVVNVTPNNMLKLSRTPLSELDFAVAASIIYALFEDEVKDKKIYQPHGKKEFLAGEISLNGEIKSVCNPLIFEAALLANENNNSMENSILCLSQKNKFNIQSETQITEYYINLKQWFEKRKEKEEKNQINSEKTENKLHTTINDIPGSFEKRNISSITNTISLLIKNPKLCVSLIAAAAGRHNILVAGEPGVGKSFAIQKFQNLLPPLTQKERIEVQLIHSTTSSVTKPFRSPHHSSTSAALIGGSSLKPGEVSLAHNGVLFLDELAEFSRTALESLREPLDSNAVFLSRSAGTIRYPAHFQLCATSNPCACGYLFSRKKPCRCNPRESKKYIQKLSGPLLDRFCLQIWVEPAYANPVGDIFSDYLMKVIHNGELEKFAVNFVKIQHNYINLTSERELGGVHKNTHLFNLSLRGNEKIESVYKTFQLLFPELEKSSEFYNTVLSYREMADMFTNNIIL